MDSARLSQRTRAQLEQWAELQRDGREGPGWRWGALSFLAACIGLLAALAAVNGGG